MNKIKKLRHVLSTCTEGRFRLEQYGQWWTVTIDNDACSAEFNASWRFKTICESIIEALAQSGCASNMEYIHAISGAAMNEGVK